MPFNPNLPIENTLGDAAEMRAQFNGLKDLIDAIPAGPPGPQGDPGPQGPAMSFPIAGPGIIQGRVIADDGDLSIAHDDANGSAETSLVHGSDTATGTPLPVVTGKVGGGTVYSIRVDWAGLVDGAGVPSTPHNAVLIYDGASALWKPILGVTQTLVVGDGSGGTLTLQIVGGLIVSVT